RAAIIHSTNSLIARARFSRNWTKLALKICLRKTRKDWWIYCLNSRQTISRTEQRIVVVYLGRISSRIHRLYRKSRMKKFEVVDAQAYPPYVQASSQEVVFANLQAIKNPKFFRTSGLYMVPGPGIEPGTRGFSIHCSTD